MAQQPTSDLEARLFFGTRLVFILMLIIDYANVTYYNKGLERGLGAVGLGGAILIAIGDFLGIFELIKITGAGTGEFLIVGAEGNFVTEGLILSANSYFFYTFAFIMVIMGLEVANVGIRSIINPPKEKRKKGDNNNKGRKTKPASAAMEG
ncbi:hypothetical protein MKX54_14195 [Alkalihalobacillus sp. FSL R5-0424]